jgi:hypothetical protein
MPSDDQNVRAAVRAAIQQKGAKERRRVAEGCAEQAPIREKRRYTLRDLEEAERRSAEGDDGRHSNPGRTRRWNREADEEVSRIRQALIEQGDLPDPAKSLERIEKDRIERGLLAVRNNPDHNEIVEFEGKRYQCKYYKLDGFWFRDWKLVQV